MTNAVQHPHDKFFRESFSRPEIAVDFVRSYLPREIVEQLDLDTLEIVDGIFVDSDLEQQQSDILYKLRTLQDEDFYVYLLLEHKSKPERTIFIQLLQYIARIWKQEWRANAAQPLVPIFPLVVYHGESAWNITTHLSDLLHALPNIAPHTPDFRYEVVDLSPFSDVAIRGGIWLRLCLGILRSAFDPAVAKRLPDLIHLMNQLQQQETGLGYIETVLRYLSVGAKNLPRKELQQTYIRHSADGGKLLMTFAEELFQEGKREGKREGELSALHEMIGTLLIKRFGNVPNELLEQITSLSNLEQLQQLTISAALSPDLDQFVATISKP